MTEFGGDWTNEKLDRVSAYLQAFLTALKKQRFRLVYVDAFCGDGGVELKSDELPLLNVGRAFTEGSARRALQCMPPFDRYEFIDLSQASLDKLRGFVGANNPDLADRVGYHCGDVNIELPKVTDALSQQTDRAVVFADPFALQLDWSTIEAASRAIIDFWYLVPTMAINRMLAHHGQIPDTWGARIDRFLGTPDWRGRWYKPSPQGELFGSPRVERVVNVEQIEADIHDRLALVFHMAPKRMRLMDRGRHLFTLMFGCSNPNPRAHGIAIAIANHLLRE